MAITQFSTTPLSTAPATFDTRMDTRITEQERFVTEANAMALEMNLYATYGPGAALTPSGFKNRIINGGMLVAQAPNVTLSAALQYGAVDMMQGVASVGTGISGTLTQAVNSNFKSGNCLAFSSVSWTNATAQVHHRIEARNVQDLNGSAITIQCKVFHDTGTNRTFAFALRKANTYDNFTAITAINAGFGSKVCPSGQYTTLTGTITLSATDALNGLDLVVYDTVANTVVNKNYYVGDWQLEAGSIATSFEVQEFGAVKRACGNYFRAGASLYGVSYATTTSQICAQCRFEPMRLNNPAIALSNTTYQFASGATVIHATASGFNVVALGTSAGSNSFVLTDWSASCRL